MISKVRNIATVVCLSIIFSGCTGSAPKGGGSAKKSEPAQTAEPQKTATPRDEASSELTREFNTNGNGKFNVQVVSDKSSTSEVVLSVVVDCQLAWQQTDKGFRSKQGKDAGAEIILANSEGNEVSPAKLESIDLNAISLKGRFVRRSDEDGKLISEGDQRLLDYLGWPEGMKIAEFRSTADSLVVRSQQYRITLQRRDKELEEGYHWEVTSVDLIEGSN